MTKLIVSFFPATITNSAAPIQTHQEVFDKLMFDVLIKVFETLKLLLFLSSSFLYSEGSGSFSNLDLK